MQKPEYCSKCPFTNQSTGFCPDTIHKEALITLIGKAPGKDDIVNGAPMTGKMGWYTWKTFLTPLGFGKKDVNILNVLRCYPNNKGEFPVGKLRKQAIEYCRHWDQSSLSTKKHDVIGITFNPAALMRSPQQTVFVRRAFTRAKMFAAEGLVPILLLGEEAREKFMPWLSGPMKKWNGHWEKYNESKKS
jgi:uracil-DNA glycosylase